MVVAAMLVMQPGPFERFSFSKPLAALFESGLSLVCC